MFLAQMSSQILSLSKDFGSSRLSDDGSSITNGFLSINIMPQKDSSILAKASYNLQLPTYFGKLFAVAGVNFTYSNAATAALQLPSYHNIYLLLDTSPSMAMGADADSSAAMLAFTDSMTTTTKKNNPNGQSEWEACYFACHMMNLSIFIFRS